MIIIPYEETIIVNGKPIEIWYDALDFRDKAVAEAHSLAEAQAQSLSVCPSCNINQNRIQNLSNDGSVNTNNINTNDINTNALSEIVNIDGSEIRIWYDTPEYRNAALSEAMSLYTNKDVISLAATCPTASKTAGQVVNLSSTPASGVSPYTFQFWKISPGGTKTNITGSPVPPATGTTGTSSYTTLSTDVGTLTVGVDITDSCTAAGGGPKTATEQCSVTVVAPSCSLTNGGFSLSGGGTITSCAALTTTAVQANAMVTFNSGDIGKTYTCVFNIYTPTGGSTPVTYTTPSVTISAVNTTFTALLTTIVGTVTAGTYSFGTITIKDSLGNAYCSGSPVVSGGICASVAFTAPCAIPVPNLNVT